MVDLIFFTRLRSRSETLLSEDSKSWFMCAIFKVFSETAVRVGRAFRYLEIVSWRLVIPFSSFVFASLLYVFSRTMSDQTPLNLPLCWRTVKLPFMNSNFTAAGRSFMAAVSWGRHDMYLLCQTIRCMEASLLFLEMEVPIPDLSAAMNLSELI